jgi:hypothetical protein
MLYLPVDDIKASKDRGECDSGDDVNLLSAELKVVEPLGEEVPAADRDFAVQKTAGRNHRSSL